MTFSFDTSSVSATPAAQPVPITTIDKIETVKPKKIRAPRHDFKDGHGRVFAHRHANGNGWVADTARVAESAYIGSRAQVAQFARVNDTCRLQGVAKVYGHAQLSGGVLIKGSAEIYGRACIRDTVQIDNNVRVYGNAVVSGDSIIKDNAHVAESANVISSRLNNDGRIRGAATVLRSVFYGPVTIAGNASIVSSTVSGYVTVDDFAQILHSTVNASNNRDYGGIEIRNFAIISDNSRIYLDNTVIRNHMVIVRTSMSGGNIDNTRLVFETNAVFYHRTFNSRNAVMDALANIGALRNAGWSADPMTPVTAANAQTAQRTPINVDIGARRVMRLQDSNT